MHLDQQLPEDSRDAADAILIAAAVQGMDLRDLAMLAAEITARACPPDPDTSFEDRAVRCRPRSTVPGCCRGT